VGIGDWGLGIAIPNPQSPIPKVINNIIITQLNYYIINNNSIYINKNKLFINYKL